MAQAKLTNEEREHISMWIHSNPGTSRASGLTRLWSAYEALEAEAKRLTACEALDAKRARQEKLGMVSSKEKRRAPRKRSD